MHSSKRIVSVAALVACSLGMWTGSVYAQQEVVKSKDGLWSIMSAMPADAARSEPWIRPVEGVPVKLNVGAMSQTLAAAPKEEGGARAQTIIELPTPEGGFAAFSVFESPIMEPELAAKFPEIRTYAGQGIDDPAATVRITMTPAGFDAQVLSPSGAFYIDRLTKGDDENYSSYNRAGYKKDVPEFTCFTIDDGKGQPVVGGGGERMTMRSGSTTRTYRLAVSATGEFTAFHGGTVAGGLAAVTTIVNRINGIYQNEFSASLVLVANNNLLIYTNAATDPFTSPGANSTTNTANTTSVNAAIGLANYDVGHVFHRGANNGLAGGIGNVCAATKAQGTSVTEPPVGDLFAVDYAAHELGHQFGMRHTFNNCSGSQGDASTLAVEPGSGSTIMAYAGICGTTNIQNNSDPYFHAINFDQFLVYQGGTGGCPTAVATGNTAPTVSAGLDYTIPFGTPFTLTATGSDPNGDSLTYCWETTTGGTAITPGTDNGSSPIIRSRNPVASPSRTVPQLSNLLANTTSIGEILPTQARTMQWRVTARDNRANNGGINTDDMTLTVASAGPFAVTSPNTNVNWSGVQTVTWAVNGTNAAPINTANVNILLSTDGGNTFPTVLASNTPNDGSQSVLLPNINSNQARIRIEAVGNIYFDISNVNFTVSFIPPGANLEGSGTNSTSDATPTGNNNGVVEPGEGNVAVTIGVRNTGATTATLVTGTVTSLTPTVSVVTATAAYPDLALGASAGNATPYIVNVSPDHPCGAPFSLQLDINSNEDTGSTVATFSTGTALPADFTVSYTGPASAIPDAVATGVNQTLTVAGVGSISDLNFRFDGSSCNTTATSTTVGVSHSWVGDLVVTLTSPSGTSAVIINRPGSGDFGSSGNNFCQTVLDDDSGAASIESIVPTGNPYSGTFTPQAALSVFDGENADGVWTLNVADLAATDTGSVRSWSLIFAGTGGFECDPALPPVNCLGDANGDNAVTFDDITTVLGTFGSAVEPFGTGDANGDGVVSFDDITTVLGNFGSNCQ